MAHNGYVVCAPEKNRGADFMLTPSEGQTSYTLHYDDFMIQMLFNYDSIRRGEDGVEYIYAAPRKLDEYINKMNPNSKLAEENIKERRNMGRNEDDSLEVSLDPVEIERAKNCYFNNDDDNDWLEDKDGNGVYLPF